MTATCKLLPDGKRLHLNHGPIDLIIEADGASEEVAAAYHAATTRFVTVLDELVAELPLLRTELTFPFFDETGATNTPHPVLRTTFSPEGRSELDTEFSASVHLSPPGRGFREAAREGPERHGQFASQHEGESKTPNGPIARSMIAAVLPYAQERITPMAAVAGAVADEILRPMTNAATLRRAYVNNGGDIAIHLAPGEVFAIAAPSGKIVIQSGDGIGGMATSGWRGRSFSLGIADAVTVLAATAREADAAATMIANRIDLPGSPKIRRQPANQIAPDSDLKDRLVTIGVEPLTGAETRQALGHGARYAQSLCDSGLIDAAALGLNGTSRMLTRQQELAAHA